MGTRKLLAILLLSGGLIGNVFAQQRTGRISTSSTSVSEELLQMPKIERHSPKMTDVEAKRSLNIKVYNLHKAIFVDQTYIGIKHSYFEKFNTWFIPATKHLKYRGKGDAYDCDNFAYLYRSLMSASGYKSWSENELLVGVIFVKQKKDWGGISGGDYLHALNLMYTSEGWHVVEPQTGFAGKLKNYPNQIIWYIF